MAVPLALRDKYDAVAPLISAFCDDHLNDEYKALCLRLLEKLCRKRPSPLLSGREETWAAGIVYAIAANNFIFDKENPYYMSAREIAEEFDLSAATAANKASGIRRMFNISYLNTEWLLKENAQDNPAVWMLNVDGFIVDIRDMPLHIQKLAFDKGFIPYVPGENSPEDN
jgi:hypothetical protein